LRFLTGKYALSDLFSPVPGSSKLPVLEKQILATLKQPDETGKSLSDYGIEATSVGIHRVRLAEQTTQAVNDRIAANRDRLAKEIESAGDAEAEAIKAKAEADRQRILAFADRRAQLIRAEGDIAAAEFVGQMNTHPDLAVFLKNLDFMSKAFSDRTTVILSTQVPGLSLIDPDATSKLGANGLPSSNMPQAWRKLAENDAQQVDDHSNEEDSR